MLNRLPLPVLAFIALSALQAARADCKIPDTIMKAESLLVMECAPLGDEFVDLRKGTGRVVSCSPVSGVSVKTGFPDEDQINGFVTMTGPDGSSKRVVPSPPSPLSTNMISTSPGLACGDSRWYFVHPISGYITAYGLDGELLWQAQLPGFKRIDSDSSVSGLEVPDLMARLVGPEASVALRASASGSYVAVGWRNGFQSLECAIFHRSGRLAAHWGPWDAVLIDGGSGGAFAFAVNGGGDVRSYIPTHRIQAAVSDGRLDLLLRHALAWFQPRTTSASFEVHCAQRSDDEIRHWLGKDFVPEYATLSKVIFGRLAGTGQLDKLLDRPAIAAARASYHPVKQEWRSQYSRALVGAGIDVELARVITPQDLEGLSTPKTGASNETTQGATVRGPGADPLAVPIQVALSGQRLSEACGLFRVASGLECRVPQECDVQLNGVQGGTLKEILDKIAASYGITYVREGALIRWHCAEGK